MFYEADTVYIGFRSKGEHCQGCATEQQPFFQQFYQPEKENSFSLYLKLHIIPLDNSGVMEK